MKKKKSSILFWITGLPGTGKTSIANVLFKKINKIYGPTILLNGNDLRECFHLTGYTKTERKKIGLMYSNFFLRLIKQNINIVFAGGAMSHKVQKFNRDKIKNYMEILIKSDLKKK